MNKRFFTLLAGAALLFSTAFAAPAGPEKATTLKENTLYHLLSGTKDLLYVKGDTLFLGDTAAINAASVSLLNSLWCASAYTSEGSSPLFTFTNKGAETYLSLKLDSFFVSKKTSFPAIINEGDVLEWKFSNTVSNLDATSNYLASYIKDDTIAVLANDALGNVVVDIVPAPASTDPTLPVGHTLLKFNLATAAPRVLTAAEFNTVLGTKEAGAQKLIFDPDRNGVTSHKNPFTDYDLTAKDASTSGYVKFTKGSAKSDTLRVDTSYINAQGIEFLAFAFDSVVPAIKKQYEFQLTYYPSNDSLTIHVAEARYKDLNGLFTDVKTNQFVSIQDLVKADQIRIVTVGEKQNTDISFGIGGCPIVSDNRTSVDAGLYLIKNAEGKYLAAPIYTDSSTTTLAKALWVNLEANVEPSRLPAYQWVVEKTRTNAKYAGTSPITITNREYQDIVLATSYQLKKEGLSSVIPSIGVSLDSTYFNAITDNIIKNDTTLGYKAVNLANQEYKTYVYSFNYLHQFNDKKYLEVTNDKNDTLIYVGEDKTSFELVPQSLDTLVPYGKTISGLAQLKRVSYKLKVKDSYKFNHVGKFVAIDEAHDRYTLVSNETAASVFFLKENNYKNGKPYYALVDTTTLDVVKYQEGYVKIAIDDNNVYAKVNPITEIRTSAFAVEHNDDPLYRKFVTDNNPDTLRFFRERESSDVLYENAHLQYGEYGLADTSINFLGVRNIDLLKKDGVERGYSFYVDTAYVNRGTGIVKPQYLIAVRPEVIAPNATRAWFLINATQYGVDANNVKDYQWNANWDRLVFVEGVRKGDSLYIFQPGFSPETINFAALKSESKARFYNLGNNKHKDVVWQFRLINNIKEDPSQTFLIESENEFRTSTNPTPSTDGVSNYGADITPFKGGWVKVQNGVPVISRSFYEEAILDAEKFNVEVTSEAPVANEGISATDVTVVGGAGNVTIFNAAGKKVTISNILGQAVANTVLSSDQATISVPKGVVVVAVEGEKAVKAVVK